MAAWRDPGAPFTAVVQLGTMVAELVYFRRDLARIGAAWVRSVVRRETPATLEAKLGWYLILATIPNRIPAAVPGPTFHAHLRGLPRAVGGRRLGSGGIGHDRLSWAATRRGREGQHSRNGRLARDVTAAAHIHRVGSERALNSPVVVGYDGTPPSRAAARWAPARAAGECRVVIVHAIGVLPLGASTPSMSCCDANASVAPRGCRRGEIADRQPVDRRARHMIGSHETRVLAQDRAITGHRTHGHLQHPITIGIESGRLNVHDVECQLARVCGEDAPGEPEALEPYP